ncbi:hypothetical protein DWB61_08380 [Ancylomarina euxinus]|uniref:Uncharacterized protein n=1 Tax=Ancylomarina euxinus TaxID=2283627 RepID=A0A425Y2L9_9BACT|nr:hypothetical protein DWB61_08380 [Ancylomarina euxinus]
MKNFSIRFILLILLVVIVPTIQKMVLGTQQKAQLSTPISDLEESKFENDYEEPDSQFICSFLKFFKHFKLPNQFSYKVSALSHSLADSILLPPPQF